MYSHPIGLDAASHEWLKIKGTGMVVVLDWDLMYLMMATSFWHRLPRQNSCGFVMRKMSCLSWFGFKNFQFNSFFKMMSF